MAADGLKRREMLEESHGEVREWTKRHAWNASPQSNHISDLAAVRGDAGRETFVDHRLQGKFKDRYGDWRAVATKVCAECGTSYHPRYDSFDRSRFCSVSCRSKFGGARTRGLLTGEKNPSWKGGASANNYAYKKRSVARYPERNRARRKVRDHIRAGRLNRQPCEVCGTPNAHAHHDDYSRPLDVRWLCRQHHREHHDTIGRPMGHSRPSGRRPPPGTQSAAGPR